MKKLSNGKTVSKDTPTKMTPSGRVKLSKKEIEELENRRAESKKEKEHYAFKRRDAFLAKEDSGELPVTIHDHFDAIYKALEAAELNGTELPPEMSSIIRIRRAIKTKYPKPTTTKKD